MLRKVLFGLLAVLIALLAGGWLVLSSGQYATFQLTGQAAGPYWTTRCTNPTPPSASRRCARVQGRVVWVQHHDPDGDGDRHLIVADHYHLRLVKIALALKVGHPPGIGSLVEAVGYLGRGSHDETELDSDWIRSGGVVHRRHEAAKT